MAKQLIPEDLPGLYYIGLVKETSVHKHHDRIDSVPAHANSIGQLLLGDVFDGSFYSDSVFHRTYCFWDFQSIHLNGP